MTDSQSVSDMEDEQCWVQLEDYRMLLIKTIEPSRITPYLRHCKVLSSEDEEQIFNDPSLVTRQRKVGVLLDILQRTGHKGYVTFLESLELDYPRLYRKITGKEPARVFSVLVDTVGESGLTQFLMSEVTRLQKGLQEERRRRQEATWAAATQEDSLRQQQVKERELRKQQERVQCMREERDRQWEVVCHLKDENYSLMHNLTKLSEEKNSALMSNRDLQLEIEKLKHSLMKAESDSKIQRKQTVNLKNAIEERPSQDMIWQLQRHNDLLTVRIQELESSAQQGTAPAPLDQEKLSVESLENYKQHSQAQHQELVNNIYNLRRDLHDAEALRNRYLEAKEVLELKCTTLKKDAKMYRDRMEDILKQMDEVIRERDKAIASREEYHQENSRSLQEKDQYRKQIRELGERCDELQVQLFRTEAEVMALQTRLHINTCSPHDKSQTSEEDCRDTLTEASSGDLQCQTSGEYDVCIALQVHPLCAEGSPEDNISGERALSEDEPSDCSKPRERCNFYYRRKRALRRSKATCKECKPCVLDNSCGSDNTDTDGM
ncbi:caspase recruitment domain-containing protein 9 isoform X1 [Salmo salar]|uniref:Caspase recruitment domain-containing protein 9 isoform X1 n=1 Tax=Salmo salar TaxID=8030 RepID=A0A1S3PIQ3_SALSA|nr:caspase recruitment domain-containing protein 9 isoform X1 [Salmo salar]|eukprot:XP_014027527.1 PREDICTED: caspase recruitment domain-containing protein 9-like isoform X1 [Salmo salar]